MKIYMVTNGEYSNFKVCGVYSTPAKAEEARRLFNACHNVEEWDVDALPDHPPGMLMYNIEMDVIGTVVSIERTRPEYPIQDDWFLSFNVPPTVVLSLWAKDEAHAVKIANERRTQLIALNRWTISRKDWRIQKEKEIKEAKRTT